VERLATVTPRTVAAPELPNLELAQALAALGERDREALLLTAWEGLTSEQAARALGCSAPAFRVRVHRARRKLQTTLAKYDEHDEIRAIAEVSND
jgi:RNA polymerase sigma-70 factor (ECF subfamily)